MDVKILPNFPFYIVKPLCKCVSGAIYSLINGIMNSTATLKILLIPIPSILKINWFIIMIIFKLNQYQYESIKKILLADEQFLYVHGVEGLERLRVTPFTIKEYVKHKFNGIYNTEQYHSMKIKT